MFKAFHLVKIFKYLQKQLLEYQCIISINRITGKLLTLGDRIKVYGNICLPVILGIMFTSMLEYSSLQQEHHLAGFMLCSISLAQMMERE